MAGYEWTYDVFISFRGADTRLGFTRNLYRALTERGNHTFMDDGEQIPAALPKAIGPSRISIVVFSKACPFPSFCLDELAKICQCFDKKDLLVYPVFYDVDPSDVRRQRGGYGEALARHEKRFKDNKELVHRWRTALHQVASLSGFLFKQGVLVLTVASVVEPFLSPQHRQNIPQGRPELISGVRIDIMAEKTNEKSNPGTTCWLGAQLLSLKQGMVKEGEELALVQSGSNPYGGSNLLTTSRSENCKHTTMHGMDAGPLRS